MNSHFCSKFKEILLRTTVFFVDVYIKFISPFKPPCCRFFPSCSSYSRDSFLTHGFLKGLYLTIKRLCKCHPLHPGGIDPVPLNTYRTRPNG